MYSVQTEHRQAKLKKFNKKGLGHIELKLEFFRDSRPGVKFGRGPPPIPRESIPVVAARATSADEDATMLRRQATTSNARNARVNAQHMADNQRATSRRNFNLGRA